MLTYQSKTWQEGGRQSAGYRSLLFSAPVKFNMNRGGTRRLHVASAELPGIGTSLLNVASSGHEIDVADDKFLTIMLPTRGRTHVRMDRKDSVIVEGAALALGPSERSTRVEPGKHGDFRADLAKISLDSAPLRHALRRDGGDPVLPLAPRALAGFRALIHYLFSDLASPTPTLNRRPASDLFEALVVEHLRLLLTGANSESCGNHPQRRLVRGAKEFMAAHMNEPLTVPVIAKAAGVSVRRLQNAFRKTTGQTPWEWLTAFRMEQARLRLLAGDGFTVTEIAFDCGISHLGRFGQAYRAAFDETPSATLRRAKAMTDANRTGGPP